MTSIFLVRHGESAANAGQATHDPALIPLTPEGIAQAEQLAQSMDRRPARVASSHYLRARDTAQATCERWGLQADVLPLLYEFVTLPPAEVAGTTNLERKPLIDSYWQRADPDHRSGAGAESFREFAGRVDATRAVFDGLPDGSVVFGHGMWFAMLVWRTMRFPVDTRRSMLAFRAFQLGLPMPNCCMYELHGGPGAWGVAFHAELPVEIPTPREQAYAIQ